MKSPQVVFVIVLCTSVTARGAAVTLLNPLTVRIYDSAGLDAGVMQPALAVAARTLAAASVDVTWMHCAPRDAPPTSCAARPSAGELIVRMVRLPVRPSPGGVRPLGDALVDAGARSAVLATIYVDRVTHLAEAAGTETSTLLGHAMAHELGHLLLATGAHAVHGLMRPIWTREELRQGRAADWRFTRQEIAAIRSRAAVRTAAHLGWSD
jgi:hypothetical protein